jgi:hypothetical protein
MTALLTGQRGCVVAGGDLTLAINSSYGFPEDCYSGYRGQARGNSFGHEPPAPQRIGATAAAVGRGFSTLAGSGTG